MASRKFDRTGLAAAGVMSAAVVFSATLGNAARAEPAPQPSAAEIAKRLQRLSVVGSVLYVAAHPDDENTALLTYLATGRGVRAVYLSMTRGDGGQNLIGAEQGIALGIIRTQELLAARRIDGAEQMFTRARDFGFSKSVDETLKIWGEDDILADTVLAIRRVRPDLIITRFSPGGGGHGHHTASARLAEKAFKLAADPKYQPAGQPKLPPWQARRLLVNRGGSDGGGNLRLDIGSYDPLLGVSYGEMSGASRSMHKSQGFGAQRRRGPIIENFGVLAEAPGIAALKGTNPLEGLDWTWRRVPGGDRIQQLAAEAARSFRFDNPAASIPALVALDAALEKLGGGTDAEYWRTRKRAEVAQLVAACAGLHLEGVAAGPVVVPGQAVSVAVTALNRSAAPVKLVEVAFNGPALLGKRDSVAVGKALASNDPLRIERSVTAAANAVPSAPYWLREPPLPGRFQLADAALTGAPENPPALLLEVQVEIGGRRFMLGSPVFHRWTDPVAGELTRPLEVVPAVSVSPQSGALLFADGKPQPLKVRLKASAPSTTGVLKLESGGGFTAKPASTPFKLAAAGDEVELEFAIQAPKGKANAAAGLKVVADVGGRALSQRLEWIDHAHIPIQMMLTPAEVRLVPVDLRREGQRIGYVPGAGDEVAASLERVGYQVVVLDEAALTSAPLGNLDAIVLGVRAFNTNDRLRFHRDRLLDYVHKGGTLVVQYNTNNRQAKLEGGIGPLPFDIGRDRVTDETAPVAFEQPKHPVLNHPNKITAADFEGWVQERGLYFASSWDKGYEAPLAMADPGEGQPSKGSLLVARHGRGTFVYTGLAFFRQLPAGVPGAYRLFANLIAHGKLARR